MVNEKYMIHVGYCIYFFFVDAKFSLPQMQKLAFGKFIIFEIFRTLPQVLITPLDEKSCINYCFV